MTDTDAIKDTIIREASDRLIARFDRHLDADSDAAYINSAIDGAVTDAHNQLNARAVQMNNADEIFDAVWQRFNDYIAKHRF